MTSPDHAAFRNTCIFHSVICIQFSRRCCPGGEHVRMTSCACFENLVHWQVMTTVTILVAANETCVHIAVFFSCCQHSRSSSGLLPVFTLYCNSENALFAVSKEICRAAATRTLSLRPIAIATAAFVISLKRHVFVPLAQ